MEDKTIKGINTVNGVFLGIFANVLLFEYLLMLITPIGDDGLYHSITAATGLVSYFKRYQYGFAAVFVGGAAIWFLMNLLLYAKFAKKLFDETKTKRKVKSIILPAAVFLINSVSTLWVGSDIHDHADNFRKNSEVREVITPYMKYADLFLVIVSAFLIVEIFLWIRLCYIKKPMPKYCLAMCGCSILPYMSLLFTLNY